LLEEELDTIWELSQILLVAFRRLEINALTMAKTGEYIEVGGTIASA